MVEDVLVVRGVRKTYEAENAPVRALRGCDLTMRAGEFAAVMGPSGCGKSTLLNLVAGLDTADEGTILLADEEVTGKSDDELARMRRRHIGIVFQFFNLLEGMSVLENVALPAIVAGMKRRPAETRARDLLDLLGLSDKAKAAPGVLSGGQRQRLAIARALANQPTLVLADEPTGALDTEGGLEVLELFRRLHADGQTILMVTHNPEVAAGAQRIVHIRDGRVVDDAEAASSGRRRNRHRLTARLTSRRDGVIGFLVRAGLRRRLGSLLVLSALLGVAGGAVLGAWAGARRTDTAYPRLLERTAYSRRRRSVRRPAWRPSIPTWFGTLLGWSGSPIAYGYGAMSLAPDGTPRFEGGYYFMAAADEIGPARHLSARPPRGQDAGAVRSRRGPGERRVP